MSTNIRFKRSDIPGKVPSLDSIDLGELALNTADGKLFTKQEIKQPAGAAAIQKIIEIGATEVPNVLYVSKGGDDSNSGKTLGQSFLTLKKALSVATPGTTVFLKSGEYIEDNPLRVPARVSIVGDNLRNATVRPKNPTKDIFWVYNGAYIFQMNFKGHIAPSAAVCFPPDGSAGEIVTSPYTQAVTSITTTGTGMRVDGALTTGLRSMVCDAFTQYNQGGIGIHMLNRGNTQLVSIFTICCDISFMCENGGFCSVNLSNSSFGNYGLVSRGASDPLYRGVVKKSSGRQITFKNLAKRPNIGDGVLFANYNQTTCDRDNGLVVDGLAFDLLYEGTTQSTFAGLRYWAKDAITTGIQQQEQTAAAIKRARIAAAAIARDVVFSSPGNSASQVRASTLGVSAGSLTAKRIVEEEFDVISRIVSEGPVSPSLIIGPDLDAAEPEYKTLRGQVLDRTAQIVDQTIAFIKKNYPGVAFIESKCKRDVALVLEAVADDMIFGTNYKTIKAAIRYITANADEFNVSEDQRPATIEAFKFARDKIVPIVQEDATLLARVQGCFEIITTALQTEANGGGAPYIADITSYTSSDDNKLVFPAQQDSEEPVLNLVKNLQANKEFVKAEIVDYINKNWPQVIAYGYNETVCARDIGYAIDGICYDMTYGGNSQTLDAAKRYFNYASGLNELQSSEEVPATTDAFGRTQLLAQRVVILDDIIPGQAPVPQVTTDLVATNQTQVNRLGTLFALFLKQLETETVGTSDFIQPNGARLNDVGLEDAFDLLQANKQFIRNDVINYLARAYPGFDFDRVKCSRDVGYIVDSVCFDLVHGGNRQAVTAGIYYFEFNEDTNVLKSVIPNQIKQTVNAYKYMKELIRDVLTCSPSPNPWQGNVPQRIDLPPATSSEVVAIGNLIDIINEILVEGPNNAEDSIQRIKQPIALTASNDANKVRAFDLLMANRQFIQAEMLAYINQNWYTISEGDTQFARVNTATELTLGTTTTGYPTVTYQPTVFKAIRDTVLAAKEDIKKETIKFMANSFFDNFSFNKPKCYRDVGLILDAILSDMIFGSNYKTITAAISYLRAYASEVIGPQKVQTIASLKAAKAITLKRIVTPAAKTEISTRFDIIIDILEKESGAGYTLAYPIPVRNNEEDIDRKTAVDILRANIDFIKDEVVAYIDANFTLNEFDREKCSRDTGLIIDAMGYDLMFLSNFRSISAGRAYLRANANKVTGNQKLATLGAFRHLKKLAAELVKGNSLAVNSVQRSMDIILDILDKGEEAVPKFIIPFPEKGRSIEYKRARDLVAKNRDFIIDDVMTYVNTPGLSLLKGTVLHRQENGVFLTNGTFTCPGTDFGNTISSGDLIRVSGTLFGTSTIGGYSSPTVYKVSSVTPGSSTTVFTLVNLDGSALVTSPGLTGKTTSMRFEKITTGTLDVPAGFDADKCRRDVGLILDAVFYDTTYGGTLEAEVAAKSYFVGAVNQLDPTGTQSDEIDFSIRAYEYLRTVVLEVAQDNVWTPCVGNTTVQVNSPNGSDGSQVAARDMVVGIDLILNFLRDDSSPETTQASEPSLDWVDPKALAAHQALQAAKEDTKDAVSNYVEDNYVLFGYDRTKCARDVGYVIEAVRYDMMFNSNFRSIVAGRSYYRAMASTVVKDQKNATLASFQYLKEKLLEVVAARDADNPTPAESTAIQRVSRSMDIILKILENGLTAEPTVLWPDPTGGSGSVYNDAARTLLRDDIDDNRVAIEDALITWINNNNPDNVAYNETACRRDVAYILDALHYDLTYGGNLETRIAAQAYYGGTTDVNLALGAGESSLTLAAYEQLKTIINDNTTASITPASNLIDVIIDYIDTATLASATVPSITWVDVGIKAFNTKLADQDKVDVLKQQVTDFVDLNFAYNRDKCARDVGFLIDALCYDLLYGGNVDTTQAAVAYFDGAVTPKSTIPKQIIQTVAAYERLKEVLSQVVQLKDVTASSDKFTAKARITGSMDLVIKILTDGPAFTPARPFLMPLPTSGTGNASDVDYLNARNLLTANRNFIKAETIAYIDANSPPAYNKAKCERDIDLILDAVIYDVTYGGNSATKLAAVAYYDVTTTLGAGEATATSAAYARMALLLESVALAQRVDTFDTVSQNRVIQVISEAGGAAAAAKARALVEDIIVPRIDDGADTNEAALDLPSTAWVDAKLVAISDALDDVDFRMAVKDRVYDLLTAKFPDINYVGATVTQCEQDIDSVIDAVRFDLMFGSNYRSQLAGNAYYRVVAATVLSTQKDGSIATFEAVKDSMLDLIASYVIEQDKSGQAGNATAGGAAADLIGDIVAYINNSVNDPTETEAATAWVDPDLVALSDDLDGAKTATKQAITAYISDRFPELDYDTNDCEEDIVSIIDAVRFDMMFNSNFRTISAARAYFRAQAALAVGAQKVATLEAFRLLKEKLAALTSTNALALERVSSRMDLLIKIVDKGEKAIPAYELSSPTGYNTTYLASYGYARNLIESNREFIKLEIRKYLSSDPQFATLDFNEEKCIRDVDLILDAVYYDMTYGGNMETIVAGGAYYRGTRAADLGVGQNPAITGDDVNATIAAYTYLQTLIENIAQGKDVSQLQIVIPQVTGAPGSIAGAQTAKNLAFVVRNLINKTGTFAVKSPVQVNPSSSWVEPALKDPNDIIELYKTSDSASTGYAGRYSLQAQMTEWIKAQQRMATPGDGGPGSRTAEEPTTGALLPLGTTPGTLQIAPVGDWSLWFASNTVVDAADIESGKRYKIITTGGTSFTTIGASSNTAGTVFTANADGTGLTGTGTVYECFNYDVEKCERDIGLIIDAVRYDMMFGTTFRTRTAARSYWRTQANSALNSGDGLVQVYPQTEQSALMFEFLQARMRTLPDTYPRAGATVQLEGIANPSLAYTRITDLMDIVIDTVRATDLDDAVDNVLPKKPYSLPLPGGGTNNSKDLGYRAARDLIENNREFIKAELFAWIDQQKRENRNGFVTPFNFNRTKCAEDVDFILDAIFYDMTYGGNSETYTAGLAYYDGSGIDSLPADEREATIRAYNQLGLILYDVARGAKVTSLQTAIEQVKGTAGSIETAERLGQLVDIVINVVKGGTKQVPPREEPNFLAGDETLAYVRISIQEQKRELQARIADYIDSFILQYNTEKCARDVGLILDAAMYDLVLNSNFQSVTAGSVYLQKAANVVTSTQIGPQLQAIKFIRDKVIEISQTPPLVKNEAAIGRITNLFDTMFDIIDKGVEVAPEIVNVPPQGAAFNQYAVNAANSIIANKEFLKEEVVAYVTANYKTYDQSRCSRDVGLIIDAALYDLILGGNYHSVRAGISYRRATSSLVVTDQLQETLGGIDFAKQKVVELLDDANAIASITRSFELISSIIGGGSVPTTRVPLPGASVYALPRPSGRLTRDSAFKVAAQALVDAKATIKSDVSTWIKSAVNNTLTNVQIVGVAGQMTCAASPVTLEVGQAVRISGTFGGGGLANYNSAGTTYYIVATNGSTTFTLSGSLGGGGASTSTGTPTATFELLASGATADSIWDGFAYGDGTPTGTSRQTKCEEDVGFIIDAIAYDLVYGGNMETMNAGYAYYTGANDGIDNSLSSNDTDQTLAAYGYLADLVAAEVANAAGASEQAAAEAKDLILQIRNLIDSRANAVAAPSAPEVLWVDPLLQEVSVYLAGDKSRLQDVIIDYVNNINTFTDGDVATPANYDKDKCRRDVGLTLDAIRYDLMFGTSFRTIAAGRSYRRSFADVVNTGGDQNAANILAFKELKQRVLGKKLTNVTITSTSGEFSFDNASADGVRTPALKEGQPVRVQGVYSTANNPIVGYTNLASQPKTYYIKTTNGSTTFQLSDTVGGTALTTVVGATTGLTFEVRPSLEPLDEVITQGLLDTLTLNANVVAEALVSGREYKIKSLGETTVAAGNFVVGGLYEIVDVGTTPWSSLGWSNPDPGRNPVEPLTGDLFTATGEGDGTGTARFITDYTLYGASENTVGTVFVATDTPNTTTGGTGQVTTISFREAAERLFDLFIAILEDNSAEIEALGFANDADYNIPAKQGGDNTDGYFYLLNPPADGEANANVTSINNAVNAINSNRQALEDDLITWIDAQVSNKNGNFKDGFVYDAAKCREDVKFILDALAYDLTYGGNLETIVAGKAYYDGTALNALANAEVLQTIDAYNHLKDLIAALTGVSGLGETRAKALIDDLISYIDPNLVDPVVIPADTSWVDSELYVFSDKLQAEADVVAKATTDFINANYPALVGNYDVAKCRRDVKLVIDAVRWDMMFNTNFRTSVAARSYYRSQVVNGNFTTGGAGSQKPATIAAFGVVKVALDELVKGDDVVKARVAALMQLVLDILADDANVPATFNLPYGGTPNATDIGYLNARDRIEENRDFILAEMSDWLGGQTTSFAGYSEATCLRDVGLVLDALRYDLTYGGNMESVSAGKAYYAGAVLGSNNNDHKTLTKAAFLHLSAVVKAVATNDDQFDNGITPAQTLGNATGSSLAADQAEALVLTVRSYVDSNNGDAEVTPSTSWVDNNLALFASTMLDRKDSLAIQVTDFIDSEFPALKDNYDKDSCKRDVRLVVEAVRWDMMFNNVFRSWTAGRAYYRNTLNLAGDGLASLGQKDASIAGFRYLKTLLAAITGNNVTATNRVKTAMNVVLDTIEFGPTTRNGYAKLIADAVASIEAGKDSILADMATWLGGQTTNFTGYDADTCLRDVGYLVDAIKYDLTYGGNMESMVAGRSYYEGVVLGNSNASHISLTKTAFLEVASLIAALPEVAASVSARVDTLVANVNDLIDDLASVSEVYADASWSETALQEIALAMRIQTNTIKTQVTTYVDNNFPALVYDKDKCARDTGLLVDAVRWDMLFNSNFRSVTAGRSYARQALNLDGDGLASLNQKQATVAAFTYLKSVLQGIAASNAIAAERVTESMDIILEILENGLGDQADPTITYPTVTDADKTNAKAILLANKEFIKDEIISYINSTYSHFSYDEVKCARDVEYITTAVAYDMVTGSNYQTVTAALGYLRSNASNVLADQHKHVTLLAMKYLKNLLINYVGGNSDAVDAVKGLMDIVIQTIYDEGTANVPAVTFPTGNVDTTAAQQAVVAWLTNATNITNTKAAGITASGNSGGTQATCERDIGYVMQALAHDLTYGGNWATVIAARSYWVGNTQQFGSGEAAATVLAFNGVATYINAQIATAQSLNSRVSALIAVINGVVTNGLDALPAIEYPELLGADNALEAARNILISNVENAKVKTVRYANNRAYFVYDVQKCERDLGLILDAIHTDVATNSNFLTVQAANTYLMSDASGALAAPQKWAILAGLTHAKSVLSALVSTNTTLVGRIRDKLALMINIINDESISGVTLDFPTNQVTTTANQQTVATILQDGTNRTAIISAAVTAAGNSGGGTPATCERDVGYVLDALTHDMLYGGNYAITVAAKAYWFGVVANTPNLGAGEKAATLAAYTDLKTSIKATSGWPTALNATLDAKIDVLLSVLNSTDVQDRADANALVGALPSLAGATQSTAALTAAKDASVWKIFDYMNSRPYLDYTGDTVTSCERDVDVIIEALSYDIVNDNSNFKSIKAGQAYLRSYSKVVTQEQKAATIGALYFIKKAVSVALAGNATLKGYARDRMDIIIDILDRGETAIPEVLIDAAQNSDAVDTIANNADFIKAEIRAYIDRNYPELDYNRIKCERDVGFILDALRYDLAFGGNSEIREAGLAYWEGNSLTLGLHPTNIDDPNVTGGEAEKAATIAAYQHLADLVEVLLNDDQTYTPLQTVVEVGTYGGAGAAAVATDAKDLVTIVVDMVSATSLANAQAVTPSRALPTQITANATVAGLTALKGDVSDEINLAFADQFFVYNQTKCARDVGFIVEALALDVLVGGNKETRVAALEYAYKGGLVIPLATKAPTVGGFNRLVAIIDDIVDGTSITRSTGNNGALSQTTTSPSTTAIGDDVADLAQIVVDVIVGGASAAPDLVEPDVIANKTADPELLVVRAVVRDSIASIAEKTITFINETYAGFGYLQDTCKRDIGLTCDAVAYDLIYGGNSRTKFAAEQYYSGGRFQIPADSKSATVACFDYLDVLIRKVIVNEAIVTFQNYVDQNKSNPAATASEVSSVSGLFDAFTDILTNGYISVVQLDATFRSAVNDNTYATFHQVSTITTTGHTLEWVGTGIDVDSALPYNGGVPKPENQLVSEKGGFINFTSTDEKGDFRIGPDLTIKRDSGSIVGRAFNKSLLGVITPYILALQG